MVKYSIFVMFLGLTGCVAQISRNPKDSSADLLAAVRERIIQVRAMESLREIPIVFQAKDRVTSYIDTSLQGHSGARSLHDTSLAYGKLGLLPPGGDLKNTLLSFYSVQAMAFYDSRTKRVVLPAGDDTSSKNWILGERDEKVIAHELVHAYQDQQFSIGDRLRANGNGDAALALRSVAEGDAMLSEVAYVFGGLDDSLPTYVRQMLDAGEENASLPDMPMIVSDRMRFQYVSGIRFVTRALDDNGWPAVNLLYRSPPLSTEQILHPEKYFEVPDAPMRVEIKNLSRLFPPPWREIENDTLGELSVHCLFNQFLGSSAAASVAQGWDGDRFVAYRKGDEVALIWATMWDSEADATEFHERYQDILTTKYGPQAKESDSYIEKRGLMVLVIEGIGRHKINEHLDSTWADMIIQEEPFQPPINSAAIAVR